MKQTLRIGTRGSKLALAQANWVKAQIEGRHPQMAVELVIIKTTGDKIQDVPLAQVGGKGLFTKEIEEAMLAGEVDLGVHSMKDVPTEVPPGLTIGVISAREDVRDAFISQSYRSLFEIPAGGKIGTSSLRRKAQVLHLRPDLEVANLRGNVDTRLKKLETEGFAAIILAAAGLKRLGLEHVITAYLEPDQMLPAIGQGALGIEFRENDARTREALAFLDDPVVHDALTAERAFLERLQGGCQVPVAAHGRVKDGWLVLEGLIADVEGKTLLKDRVAGPPGEGEALGRKLAEMLLARGGVKILSEVYGREFK